MLDGRNRLAHALLITGPEAIGLPALGDAFANALLCESPGPSGHACRNCPACHWFDEGNHPDFRRLTPITEEAAEKAGKSAKSSRAIRVEQVRALADFVSVGAHRAGRRVVVIDPADTLNAIAANALLKTLEEPGAGVHFLLMTSRPDELPATVRSRCVRVEVAGPTRAVASNWLQSTAGVGASEADEWLSASGGAPLQALKFTEPGHSAAHRLTLEALSTLPDTSVLTAADTLGNLEPAAWLGVLQAWVSDLGRVSVRARPARFPGREKRLIALRERTSLARVTELASWLGNQRSVVEHPMNARLYCEHALFQYAGIFGEG